MRSEPNPRAAVAPERWYVVFDSQTGALYSSGTVPADPQDLPGHLQLRPLADDESNPGTPGVTWNQGLRRFVEEPNANR